MRRLRPIKMRIDIFLAENGYAQSRTEAKNLINSGAVTVNGSIVTKPSYDVCGDETIAVSRESQKYVSRGGFKLECAIRSFDFLIEGRLALDVGASSGGFTDCLLKNGAKHVLAVDTGYGQLSPMLLQDERVTSIENFNARYMTPSDLPYTPDIAVMDVSFISATYIIPAVYDCLAKDGDFICLIKPQFEVGKSGLGKGGIVKNAKLRDMAVHKVIEFAKSQGFLFIEKIESPISGGDGNIEYLAHFRKAVVL